MEVKNVRTEEKLDTATIVDGPSDYVKPVVAETEIPGMLFRLYGMQPTDIKPLQGYDDLNFYFRTKDVWENDHIDPMHEHGFILKIINSTLSSNPSFIEAQHQLLKHVRDRGIPTNIVVTNRQGKEWSLETFRHTLNGCELISGPHLVRVTTFIPGEVFQDTPYVPGSIYNIGQCVGRLHRAFKGFQHPFYDTSSMLWSMINCPCLQDYVHIVDDEEDRRNIRRVIDDFKRHVLPNCKHFNEGIIHGDLNHTNLIMAEVPDQDHMLLESRVYDVTGLIDFSEVMSSYTVFDVAICLAYLCLKSPDDDQMDVGGHFLAGYFKHSHLNDVEIGCLKTLICCRLCQSAVYGTHACMKQPDNTYIMSSVKAAWPVLRKLWKTDEEKLRARWNIILQTYQSS